VRHFTLDARILDDQPSTELANSFDAEFKDEFGITEAGLPYSLDDSFRVSF
jgi:hypothetical protein